jgi:threo-3-hydroxy-L-aspartate ammonia-lyase
MVAQALKVSYADVESAAENVRGIVHRTPVFTCGQADRRSNAQLFFKCENFQRGGSFKLRGAYNAISRLHQTQKERGVVAFSSGNHAQGVALAARMLNVPATIVMPHNAPAIKLAATRGYGAEVICYDREKEDRKAIAEQLAGERGMTLIPPFDHPHIIAGQGTVAKELIEEVGALDYLLVCVGGGGLISGCAIAASHLSPGCRVIGVEPEKGNDAMQSLHSGKIVEIAVPHTIADGAQSQRIGELVLPILQTHVSDIVTVSDDQLRMQMKFFMERMKMVVEPTGCLAAAAALSNAIDLSGKRVGVIVSGGNVDPRFFGESISIAKDVW